MPYSRSLVTAISADLISHHFGNPHSASASSQLTSQRIDKARLELLSFLQADPTLFDVVFTANATAAAKLVAESLRDNPGGFAYIYHIDSHTSLVGIRELAALGSECLDNNAVEQWLAPSPHAKKKHLKSPTLFAYPAQSNLTGYRPPQEWCHQVKRHLRQHSERQQIYSLYDAAAFLSTAALDYSDAARAADFTCLSLYKIFGLPDLGALIVRKECSHVFDHRKYFGGGTVEIVAPIDSQWHASKASSLHDRLEDGTVPFHSIIALSSALRTHSELFENMRNIARHTSFLARHLFEQLSALRHSSGVPVCEIYNSALPEYGHSHGPIVSFNLRDGEGRLIGKSEVEKLAAIRDIQLRTGGLCNPGGVATHLMLSADELQSNFAAGQRCGDDSDILNGKPTGVIRASLGATSSMGDVNRLIDFLAEYFVEGSNPSSLNLLTQCNQLGRSHSRLFLISKISVYPVKSCAAFDIPEDLPWKYSTTGLAWDREWCLIHRVKGTVLHQKQHPQIALIRPSVDLENHLLRICYREMRLDINLDLDAEGVAISHTLPLGPKRHNSDHGHPQELIVYSSEEIASFFTTATGVPSTLARRQRLSAMVDDLELLSREHHDLQKGLLPGEGCKQGALHLKTLANESPVLLVSQSSLNSLYRTVPFSGSSDIASPESSFRANIVIAQPGNADKSAYAEDGWTSLRIGSHESGDVCEGNQFKVIGPCHRCQTVCVDARSGTKRKEPFSTLAKTRRRDGKIWFGVHLQPLIPSECAGGGVNSGRIQHCIRVGDRVWPDDEEEE